MNEQDESRLRDMLDEARRVQRFVSDKTRSDLDTDEMLSYAVIHAIVLIGEVATQVTPETRQMYPQIQWKNIIGMRNWVIHNYRGTSFDIVWKAATVSVAELIVQLISILPSTDKTTGE